MKYSKKISFSKLMRQVTKFLKELKKEEKFFFVYLVILFLAILFLPLIRIIDISENWSDTLYLLRNNVSLFKSFIIILVSILVLMWRNWSSKIRSIISLLFWFKEVPFLLNFGLLRIILTSYIWINEWVSVAKEATTRIELTWWYFITIVLILWWLLYSLYLTLQQSKQSRKLKDIYIQEETTESKKKMKGLFSKMKGE